MKDCSGNILIIGQTVATNYLGYTHQLTLCEVVGFTPMKVKLKVIDEKVSPRRLGDEMMKFPGQLCIVTYYPSCD